MDTARQSTVPPLAVRYLPSNHHLSRPDAVIASPVTQLPIPSSQISLQSFETFARLWESVMEAEKTAYSMRMDFHRADQDFLNATQLFHKAKQDFYQAEQEHHAAEQRDKVAQNTIVQAKQAFESRTGLPYESVNARLRPMYPQGNMFVPQPQNVIDAQMSQVPLSRPNETYAGGGPVPDVAVVPLSNQTEQAQPAQTFSDHRQPHSNQNNQIPQIGEPSQLPQTFVNNRQPQNVEQHRPPQQARRSWLTEAYVAPTQPQDVQAIPIIVEPETEPAQPNPIHTTDEQPTSIQAIEIAQELEQSRSPRTIANNNQPKAVQNERLLQPAKPPQPLQTQVTDRPPQDLAHNSPAQQKKPSRLRVPSLKRRLSPSNEEPENVAKQQRTPTLDLVRSPDALRPGHVDLKRTMDKVESFLSAGQRMSHGSGIPKKPLSFTTRNLTRLADTIIQLFVQGVILFLVTRQNKMDPTRIKDVMYMLNDSSLTELDPAERDGRHGLSKRLVEKIYNCLGQHTIPRIAPIRIGGTFRTTGQVSYTFSAIFGIDTRYYPHQIWFYQEVLAMIRGRLPNNDRKEFESILKNNAAKHLTFLPSTGKLKIFHLTQMSSDVQSAGSDFDNTPETSSSPLEHLGWNAVEFGPTRKEEREIIELVQSSSHGKPGCLTLRECIFLGKAVPDLQIWSPQQPDANVPSSVIVWNAPFFGEMSVLRDPIVTCCE